MPPKKQTVGLIPIPKQNHFSQSLQIKTLFERGEIIPSSPLHPIKPLLEKNKNKIPNPLSLFLKAPFTIYNFFNLIELFTLYTH